MSRVKRGVMHNKRRRNILSKTKSYKFGRKKLIKLAITAEHLAGRNAYNGRKEKKQTARRAFEVRINAAVRQHGLTYSRFINAIKKKNIELDRKVLAELALKQPKIFTKIVESVK